MKGAATLYTKEFFDVVKEHLNPGGVVTLFVQLYESNTDAVKSEIATFFQAFPNGVVFGNTNNGARLRSRARRTARHDEDRRRRDRAASRSSRSTRRSRSRCARSASTRRRSCSRRSPATSRCCVRGSPTRRSIAIATCGCSSSPASSLNTYDQAGIYSQMLQYRRYPDGLFTGTPERMAQIRMATGGAE